MARPLGGQPGGPGRRPPGPGDGRRSRGQKPGSPRSRPKPIDPRSADRPARRGHASTSAETPARPERIAKLLARAGAGSRRDIERMIAEGRVARDGVPLATPATLVLNLEGITVDGRPVEAAQAARLFLFHKPAGVLTAARDTSGRPTIYDVLPEGLPRLMPVGRLDLMTEGLLLLTNDGALKRGLELPANAVPRTYRVRVRGMVRQADLEQLALGVEVEGVRYGPVDASIDRRASTGSANIWLSMTLREGKNREIRKLCTAMGLEVSRLIRTSFGPYSLGSLPPRAVLEVPAGEVQRLVRHPRLRAEP